MFGVVVVMCRFFSSRVLLSCVSSLFNFSFLFFFFYFGFRFVVRKYTLKDSTPVD